MSWFNIGNKQTFRPVKRQAFSQRRNSKLHNVQFGTLGLGDFRAAVRLPEGEDKSEWLAIHVVDFYDQLSMLYATITEFCTPESCPVMTAGQGYKYLWSDSTNYPRPVEVSAPKYISLLFDWVAAQIDDEKIFPSMIGVPFPPNFEQIVKNIMKRLFRIYAHCYYHHLDNFTSLGAATHLNTSFKHFIYFTQEFNLIPPEQLEPLHDLIEKLTKDE